ncbi:MAG: replication initiation factor domain-containing protein [Planctomycetota bacterium]|nr:replication initiation factor domain-containing protein [Planctomycetota bacterium]
MDNEVKASNGVELGFHWLSCSFPVKCLFTLFKILKDEPLMLDYGFRGYKSSGLLYNSSHVAWTDGREDAHLDLNGEALTYYTKGDVKRVLRLIEWVYLVGGKLSRLDTAYDDKIGLISLEQVKEAVNGGNWVSRASKFYVYDGGQRRDGEIVSMGETVCIGSKTSQINLKVYDKSKEQGLEGQHWTRVEMMLRDEAANSAAATLISAYKQGLEVFTKTAVGLLRGFCDFRDSKSDSNVTRQVLLSWWFSFTEAVEKIRLIGKQKLIRNITKVVNWIEKQVAPNLAVVKEVYGLSFPSLMQYITYKGKERWRPAHRSLLVDGIKLCGAV